MRIPRDIEKYNREQLSDPVLMTMSFLYGHGCKYERGIWLSATNKKMSKSGMSFLDATLFVRSRLIRFRIITKRGNSFRIRRTLFGNSPRKNSINMIATIKVKKVKLIKGK